MKTIKCPLCGKTWPENRCPECDLAIQRSEDDDDVIIDGDVINESWSTCAAKVRLNPIRYLRFRSETRLLAQIWLVLASLTMVVFALKWWLVGGVLAVLTLLVSVLIWWVCRRVAEIYQNAALTAGMVVGRDPLEFISIANMDSGLGESAYAVKRVEVSRLPCHSAEIGTMFPCVSGFQDGRTPHRWGDFDPQPLSFGTGDASLIQARKDKLGPYAFELLKKAFDLKRYPSKAGQLMWLGEAAANKVPPLLPKSL